MSQEYTRNLEILFSLPYNQRQFITVSNEDFVYVVKQDAVKSSQKDKENDLNGRRVIKVQNQVFSYLYLMEKQWRRELKARYGKEKDYDSMTPEERERHSEKRHQEAVEAQEDMKKLQEITIIYNDSLPTPDTDLNFHLTTDIDTIKKSWSNQDIKEISIIDAEHLKFPPGHPRPGIVYACHPTIKESYLPISQFHLKTFEHKFYEAVTLLMSLGATNIEVEHISGWSKEISVSLDAFAPKGKFDSNKKTDSKLLFKATLTGNKSPSLPNDLIWYYHEPTWVNIAEGRLNHGLKTFSLNVRYQDDFGINANLKAKILKKGFELGGEFEDHKSTVWQIKGKF